MGRRVHLEPEREGRDRADELLEILWTLREEGTDRLEEIVRQVPLEGLEGGLRALEAEGLVRFLNGEVRLEGPGEERARRVIRNHRLAERLLSDVLALEETEVESSACRFEHILSDPVTDSVCTFLGHPPICPHGKPIPRGKCCETFVREMRPLVEPLIELPAGEEARIVFIVPNTARRWDRLSALGIIPGSRLRLLQRHPSFVLQIGETTVAVDREIAREIFVTKG